MTPIVDTSDRYSPKFKAVFRRAFERHVLRLIEGYGPIQDARIREARGSTSLTLFLRAELEGEFPDTCVKIHTFARAQDIELESRHLVWDPAFGEDDVAAIEYKCSPEHIADQILTTRGEEFADLTSVSASETQWEEKYAAVSRRAFELRVLDLIQEKAPIEDARERDSIVHPIVFLRAELVGEYPKTRIRIYRYGRSLEREIPNEYGIWEPDYAVGDVADVEHMRHPGWIAAEIMMYARGG